VLGAWRSAADIEVIHDEDTLMGMLDFVSSLCVTEEGLKLVQSINPFTAMVRCFNDHRLLLSESPTLLCDVPERMGERMAEVPFTYFNLNYSYN
jgi:hypothetical protein